MENIEKINALQNRLEALETKHKENEKEISSIKNELLLLLQKQIKTTPEPIVPQQEKIKKEGPEKSEAPIIQPLTTTPKEQIQQPIKPAPTAKVKRKASWEEYIGRNLISKIGIIITIIGVAIGAKYAIDNNLINPLTRILFGYLVGIILLGFAIRLKKNYAAFSAVLLGGANTILYFITYFAYEFYELLPQPLAFTLMVFITIFTVVAAVSYNMQIIAHLALIGAYSIPFLVSENSGRADILFSYMSIINAGILIVAFRKYWKILNYVAFSITWLIFLAWYNASYDYEQHKTIFIIFLNVFFLIFYATFLAYKLIKKEKYSFMDIVFLLANSFIYYGFGYIFIDHQLYKEEILGLFTICNAIIHFIVGLVIYNNKLADRKIFYLIAILVLSFITIAVPVQMDGNWVTLLWIAEAAFLFWLGRTKKIPTYEWLTFPMIFLAFISLIHDWTNTYNNYYFQQPETKITPFLNIMFATSALFVGAFSYIIILNKNAKFESPINRENFWYKAIHYILATMFIIAVYYTFRLEISNHFSQLYSDSSIKFAINEEDSYTYYRNNSDINLFKTMWLLNYSMIFFTIWNLLNMRFIKSRIMAWHNFSLNLIVVLVFLIQGLYTLSELRESYLYPSELQVHHFPATAYHIIIRYVALAFFAVFLAIFARYLRADFIKTKFNIGFDFMVHTAILWICSSELIHWMDMAGSSAIYKLGLSILWGSYSLFLIILGIWKKKIHLRIGAICLFSITLIKLFFYDLSQLNTISKTIVFLVLGGLLLFSSYLYNKYKNVLFDNNDNEKK